MDEPKNYYTQWSKSEREKQISYMNAYMWNLERWYWWTYFQGSNGNTDIVDTVGEGEDGMNWENSTESYVFLVKNAGWII